MGNLDRAFLPMVNAGLNSTAFLLLIAGAFAIRARKTELHKGLMLAATAVSALFLACYLTHHARFGSTKFTAEGWIRPVYYTILLTHSVLAALNLPMILKTLWHALRGELDRHRAIARWTLGIWLYVSFTGVLVYLLLYRIYPSAELGG